MEALLWMVLALLSTACKPTFVSILSLINCTILLGLKRHLLEKHVGEAFRSMAPGLPTVDSPWWLLADVHGIYMCAVLVPLLLEQLHYDSLGLFSAICGTFRFWVDPTTTFAPRSLTKAFTYGEWSILTTAMAICLFRLLFVVPNKMSVSQDNLHNWISFTGVIGCALGCALSSRLSSLFLKLLVLVTTPILVLEVKLLQISIAVDQGLQNIRSVPRSIHWILTFLFYPEVSGYYTVSYPRYVWLVYWAVSLIVLLALAPSGSSTSGNSPRLVVIKRKWFHLIAIVLFTPVTIYDPKLMSLSYAIALAVLMVLETIRVHISFLQTFYEQYLDFDKDATTATTVVVVSHMALIMGCGIPLWIAEHQNINSTDDLLLSCWGILVLGVGDSLGALIGSQYGRILWSATRNNKRTLEGSLAMFTSMAFICNCWLWWSTDSNDDGTAAAAATTTTFQSWFLPTFFCTLLEAHTLQIDNLVLPLAGSLVMLVLPGI